MALNPLREKWQSFGWNAVDVDGHDIPALVEALIKHSYRSSQPLAIVAHTVKGKGVSFMEDDNNWHYRIPTADEVRRAKVELGLSQKSQLTERSRPGGPENSGRTSFDGNPGRTRESRL